MMPAQNRQTSLRQNTIRTLWALFVFLLAGVAIYAGIYFEKNTKIIDIQFSGNYFTDEQSLHDAIESPVGLFADSVEYGKLMADLRKLPYVNDVTVNMNIRGVLYFRVSEYEPVAMLAHGNNRAYVAEGGIKLPIKPGKARDVPILYGFPVNSFTDTLSTEAFKQVEKFLMAAKLYDTGWVALSEVAWSTNEGVVALTHENGVKLVFGTGEFQEKLLHWEAFYTEVILRQGIHRFSTIDLRFRDQIVVKHS
jgi:cell division protein FtsQ